MHFGKQTLVSPPDRESNVCLAAQYGIYSDASVSVQISTRKAYCIIRTSKTLIPSPREPVH